MAPDSPQMFGVALMAMWGTAGAVALGRSMAKSPAARELASAIRKMNLAAKGALVAGLVCAVAIGGTKPGGTNDPPRGLRSPPATVAVEPSFAPVEVRTNNVALRAESASAIEVEDWRKHGSSSGGVWLDFDEPVFRIGTDPVFRAHVAARGAVSFDSMRRPPVGAPLPDGTGLPALAPLLAPLGMVPEANWTSAGAASRFWHDAAPGRGRVFTWEDALLDRLPGRRVSVQAELLPSGDFTYRYDFSDALDPPATNLVIGAQAGTNEVNALAILGTNALAATVWRVDGACVANGVSIADLLCTNGVLRTPARFAIEWKNTSGIDPNADTDGDGLSDLDEVFRHGTDPNQSDTDGDGLSDSAEVLAGANPLNADENNDGEPDGVTSADWSADPLWGETAGETNLVITLVSDIPPGETATLTLGTLALPLRQARAYPLCLRPGQTIPFHLFSTCSGVVPLRIETGEEPMRSRGALRSPPVIVPPFSPAPIWVEDRERVFAPAARDGTGRIAHPVLKLVDETGRDNDVDVCLHGGATSAEWTVSILPADIGLTVADLDLYGFTRTSDDKIALSIGSGASMLDSQSGSAMLAPPVLYAGEITEWRSIHRCRGFWSTPVCHVCGFPHGPNYACSHEPDCAAVLDRNADCTCGHVYVHVAWQDADGNGTADLNDTHLVPDAGNHRFRGLGRGGRRLLLLETPRRIPDDAQARLPFDESARLRRGGRPHVAQFHLVRLHGPGQGPVAPRPGIGGRLRTARSHERHPAEDRRPRHRLGSLRHRTLVQLGNERPRRRRDQPASRLQHPNRLHAAGMGKGSEPYCFPDPRRARLLDRRDKPDRQGPLRDPSVRHHERDPDGRLRRHDPVVDRRNGGDILERRHAQHRRNERGALRTVLTSIRHHERRLAQHERGLALVRQLRQQPSLRRSRFRRHQRPGKSIFHFG